MNPVITNPNDLVDDGFECVKCGHEFTREEIQHVIENLCGEPFNGVLLECPDGDDQQKCDAVYSLDMGIRITEA